MIDELFPASFIADRAALLTVSGKLRGSRARQLGERLAELVREEGIARVVLDMRSLSSLDSLGTYALEEGLEAGLRIHLVVRPAFVFDGFFESRSLVRRGLRVHRSLEEAIERVKGLSHSGLVLV